MVFTLKTGVYLHTAYAQASDGSVGFSTTSATDAAYLGQYTDASATDATAPSRYTWMPIDLGAGAELVNEAGEEVDDGTEGLIDLLARDLYDTGQFAPDTQATGDRKVQTYFQPDEPDPEEYVFGVGDLWQDTDDGNHLYRWNGTAWVDAQDGGIGAATELAQAADTKATTAGEKAQAVQTALAGLTKIQDEQVLIDGDKVYLSAAFVRSIFAQDITATGTITGAKLIGAILSGENINIVSERVYDDTDEDGLLYQRIYTQTVIKTVQEQNGVDYLLLKQASVTDDYNDNPPVAANTPYRTNVQYGDGSYIKLTNDELFVYTPQITTNSSVKSYTSFSGGVVSDGTAVVTQKLGMCFINAGITLTGPVSGWVTLLDSDKVPAPQNGEAIIMTLPSWKAPTTNPARLRIPADGGLQITRGSANAFWINVAYPIA
jgi:hypothetical protein